MKKMLKILSVFFISGFTLLSVFLFLYAYFSSPKFLKDVSKRVNYTTLAKEHIQKNLEGKVANEKIKDALSLCFRDEKIEEDIEGMITTVYSKTDIRPTIERKTKDELTIVLKEALKNESYEEDSFMDLINTLTSTYLKDLFPYSEFKKLEGKMFLLENATIMGVFFLILTVFLILFSFFLDPKRPRKILYLSNFISGILMVIPFLFCHVFHLFQKFYYSNAYFSSYIRSIFYVIIDAIGIIGLLFLLFTMVLELKEVRNKV